MSVAWGTLEPEQLADGCGEVIKHGVIKDSRLFAQLEQTPLTTELLHSDLGMVAAIIARNVEIKRDVVAADEREAHARKLLNFGHSAGHAIEALEEYKLGPRILRGPRHGSDRKRRCHAGSLRCPACPTASPALHAVAAWTPPAAGRRSHLYEALHDKKRAGEHIDVVIPHAIGSCSIERMSLDDFHELLRAGDCRHAASGHEDMAQAAGQEANTL